MLLVWLARITLFSSLPPNAFRDFLHYSALSWIDQVFIGHAVYFYCITCALLFSSVRSNPESTLVRSNCALALGAVGPDARDAVPALTERLKDEEWTVRLQSATALGKIGPDAKPALTDLTKLEHDPQHQVAVAAKEARKRISEAH